MQLRFFYKIKTYPHLLCSWGFSPGIFSNADRNGVIMPALQIRGAPGLDRTGFVQQIQCFALGGSARTGRGAWKRDHIPGVLKDLLLTVATPFMRERIRAATTAATEVMSTDGRITVQCEEVCI